MPEGLEEIQTDIHNIEEDVKKINCSALCDLIGHTIKCITDFISCCFNKSSNSEDRFQKLNYFFHYLSHWYALNA